MIIDRKEDKVFGKTVKTVDNEIEHVGKYLIYSPGNFTVRLILNKRFNLRFSGNNNRVKGFLISHYVDSQKSGCK